jgi:DNA-binding transcriptional MocR family regulator
MSFDWEESVSARGKAMEWSPWAGRELPPPPVPPIQLTGGIPDPGSLPIDDLIACNEQVLRREGTFALMYGGPQGYGGLREWLATDINRREGTDSGPEHFVLTCGSAGGLENICETFLDTGDVAIIERPSFAGSVRTIMSCLPELAGVPMDEDGMLVDALEATVARIEREGKRAKVLYTISNYHNPAAATLTLERRKQIVEICQANGILIIQDDAYGRIGFGEPTPPSMYALAGGRGALMLGTFSKTIATGLRVGWVMGEKPVVDAITRMRFDMGVSPWTSRVIAAFCESGRFDEHLERVCGIYHHKRDAMLAALDERC